MAKHETGLKKQFPLIPIMKYR